MNRDVRVARKSPLKDEEGNKGRSGDGLSSERENCPSRGIYHQHPSGLRKRSKDGFASG